MSTSRSIDGRARAVPKAPRSSLDSSRVQSVTGPGATVRLIIPTAAQQASKR
jgi:hypothetical protein